MNRTLGLPRCPAKQLEAAPERQWFRPFACVRVMNRRHLANSGEKFQMYAIKHDNPILCNNTPTSSVEQCDSGSPRLAKSRIVVTDHAERRPAMTLPTTD